MALLTAIQAPGEEGRPPPIQSLDQQVQDIKSDVLAISAELASLEEQLLYPSDTQVAVFVSVADADGLSVESIRVAIDGETVVHHVYTQKEIDALAKGGVQRIYTGNVTTGEHEIEVGLKGKRMGAVDHEAIERSVFEKGVEPKQVGILLDSSLTSAASIQIADW